MVIDTTPRPLSGPAEPETATDRAHALWYKGLSPMGRYQLMQAAELAAGRELKPLEKLNACINYLADEAVA